MSGGGGPFRGLPTVAVTVLCPGSICKEVSERNVHKSGNSSLHLHAKGGVEPTSSSNLAFLA
jgi:hypothetical protein